MSGKPWHAPMYGGMSEESARRSYEASLLRANPDPEWVPDNPLDHEAFERKKVEIGVMLDDYAQATNEAWAWGAEWERRQIERTRRAQRPPGFKALTREAAE